MDNTPPPEEWKKTKWTTPTEQEIQDGEELRPDWEYVGREFQRICVLKARVKKMSYLTAATQNAWLAGNIVDLLPHVMDEAYAEVQWNSDAYIPEELLTHDKITKCVYDCGLFHTARREFNLAGSIDPPLIHGFQNIPWFAFTDEKRLADPSGFQEFSGNSYSDESYQAYQAWDQACLDRFPLGDDSYQACLDRFLLGDDDTADSYQAYLDRFPLGDDDTAADVVLILYDPVKRSKGVDVPLVDRLILVGHSRYLNDNKEFSNASVSGVLDVLSVRDVDLGGTYAIVDRNNYVRKFECGHETMPVAIAHRLRDENNEAEYPWNDSYPWDDTTHNSGGPFWQFAEKIDLENADILFVAANVSNHKGPLLPDPIEVYAVVKVTRRSIPNRTVEETRVTFPLTPDVAEYFQTSGDFSVEILSSDQIKLKILLKSITVEGIDTVAPYCFEEIKPERYYTVVLSIEDIKESAASGIVLNPSKTIIPVGGTWCYIDSLYIQVYVSGFMQRSTLNRTIDASRLITKAEDGRLVCYTVSDTETSDGNNTAWTTTTDTEASLTIGSKVLFTDSVLVSTEHPNVSYDLDAKVSALLTMDTEVDFYHWIETTFKRSGTTSSHALTELSYKRFFDYKGVKTLVESVVYSPEELDTVAFTGLEIDLDYERLNYNTPCYGSIEQEIDGDEVTYTHTFTDIQIAPRYMLVVGKHPYLYVGGVGIETQIIGPINSLMRGEHSTISNAYNGHIRGEYLQFSEDASLMILRSSRLDDPYTERNFLFSNGQLIDDDFILSSDDWYH